MQKKEGWPNKKGRRKAGPRENSDQGTPQEASLDGPYLARKREEKWKSPGMPAEALSRDDTQVFAEHR